MNNLRIIKETYPHGAEKFIIQRRMKFFNLWIDADIFLGHDGVFDTEQEAIKYLPYFSSHWCDKINSEVLR